MFTLHENERIQVWRQWTQIPRKDRSNFAIVRFNPGEDFAALSRDYGRKFYIIEGEVDIVVDGVKYHMKQGQFIHRTQ